MKVRFAAVIAALSVSLMACTPTTNTVAQAGATTPQRLSFGQSVDIAAVGTRLSALRASNGLARPLAHSAALQAAAQNHADAMARTGQFGHTGANGSTLSSRVRAAGYRACYGAENIAYGQNSVGQVFQDWMASPGHRTNILAAQATQFGFARTGTYSVLVVGRSC